MTVPTTGYLGLTEEEVLALSALREEWTLSPEALAAKAARQRRDRKGRWAPEGLVTAVGRRAPGWMERDVAELRTLIEDVRRDYPKRNLSPSHLREIGERVDKVARRYSASHKLKGERQQVEDRINELMNQGWDAFEAKSKLEGLERKPSSSLTAYLSDEEAAEYETLNARLLDIGKELETADSEAYLGVLRRLRPMGGELHVRDDVTVQAEQFAPEELADIDDRLAGALEEVTHVLPTEWLDEINDKGSVGFIVSTERAWHRADTGDAVQTQQVETLLARKGYEFAGYEVGLPVVRMDTGGLMAVLPDGRVRVGVLKPGAAPGVEATHALGSRLQERPWIDTEQHEMIADYLRGAYGRYEFAGFERGYPILRDLDAPDQPFTPEYTAILPGGGAWRVYPDEEKLVGEDLVPGEYVAPGVREDSTILIDPQQKGTLLHEIGHRIERYYGEESKMSGYRPMMYSLRSFLDERRRVKGHEDLREEIKPLNEILGENRYMPYERSFADEFFNAYIGKQYPDATEVLTMGLQHLFYPDYSQGMAKDDDMRHFILGMLAVT